MTNERIAEIKALCDLGPEYILRENEYDNTFSILEVEGNLLIASVEYEDDAKFLAQSRHIVAELIIALELMTDSRDRWEETVRQSGIAVFP